MDKLVQTDQQYRGRMVRLKKGEETPPGARIMTRMEVLSMQRKTIMEWKPRHEM